MTEQQESDPEYIITTAQLQAIKLALGLSDNNRLLKEIRSHPAPAAPSPCEDNGCTDIENCDEICEYSRIFSPAWVKQHDAAIRNELVSDILTRITEAQYDKSTMQDFINYVESLRSTTAKGERR